MRRILTALAGSLVVSVLLSGCATFAWLVSQQPDRSTEAQAFGEWLSAQPGVESVDTSYVGTEGVQHADAVRGSIRVSPGTDLPSLLESARRQYVTVMPDAMELHLDVDAGLPFAFEASLGEDGPSSDTTAAALEQGDALLAVGDEVAVLVLGTWGDEVRTGVRIEATDAPALFDAAARTLEVLDDDREVSASIVAGPGDVLLPGDGSDDRDRVTTRLDRSGAACLAPMADATNVFVAAEPTTRVDATVGERCTATLTVPLDDESAADRRIAEVLPLAQTWFAAMRPLAGEGKAEVVVGHDHLELG